MPTALARPKQKSTALAFADIQSKLGLTEDRIGQIVERARAGMQEFLDLQRDLEKEISKLKLELTGDVTKDRRAYEKAAELRQRIKYNRDAALELADPLVSLANALHKGLTGVRKPIEDQATLNTKSLDVKLNAFEMAINAEERRQRQEAERKQREEQERIRRDQEEADRKAKAEEKRKQEEAEEKRRKADEAAALAVKSADPAAQKQAERLAKQAETAERKADEASVNAEITGAVLQEPIEVAPVTTAPLIQRSRAAGTPVKNWSGICDDVWVGVRYILGVPSDTPLAHPELAKLITHNQGELNLIAKAQENLFSIPGFHAVNNPFRR